MKPNTLPPDRHGNPHFSDAAQVAFLDEHLKREGFSGTDRERGLIAEAWWMGDWKPNGRQPTLAEAETFVAEFRARK